MHNTELKEIVDYEEMQRRQLTSTDPFKNDNKEKRVSSNPSAREIVRSFSGRHIAFYRMAKCMVLMY